MTGREARQAIEWLKEATRARRYYLHEPHFSRRCRERGLSIDDVTHAIENLIRCEPYYGRPPTQGGSNWRVIGPSIDDEVIAVGVEAFQEEADRFVLVITLFEV